MILRAFKLLICCYMLLGSSNLRAQDLKGNQLFQIAASYFQKDLDSTLHYLHLSKNKFSEEEVLDSVLICYTAISNIENSKGNYHKSFQTLQIGIQEADGFLSKAEDLNFDQSKLLIARNYLIHNSTGMLTHEGEYSDAIEILNKVYTSEKPLNDSLQLMTTVGAIGYNYQLMGDNVEALKYLRKSINLSANLKGFDACANKSRIYRRIGECYSNLGKMDSAIVNNKLAIEKILDPKAGKGDIQTDHLLKAHYNLADAYLEQNEFEKTLQSLENAQRVSKNKYSYDQGKNDALYGQLFYKKGQFNEALSRLKSSKEISKDEFRTHKKHPIIARADKWIAKTYFQKGDFKKSIEHFNLALNELSSDSLFNQEELSPSIENLSAFKDALEIVNEKANLYRHWFQKTKKLKHLQEAHSNYLNASQIIIKLRQKFAANGSKLQLSDEVHDIFDDAIENALEGFSLSQDSSFITDAFLFSEQNKSILLNELIKENKAQKETHLPNNVSTKLEGLKLEISLIKRSIKKLATTSKPSSRDAIIQEKDKLFDIEKEYKSLLEQVEKKYPAYKKIKFDNNQITLQQVQESLDPDASLLSYFVGDKFVFIFLVQQTNFEVFRIEKNEQFELAFENLVKFVSMSPAENLGQITFSDFVAHANYLYKLLIPSGISNSKSILIIPDDKLHYLPFELLQSDIPKDVSTENYKLDNLAYLLEDHDISYAYSSELALKQKDKSVLKYELNFTGFAPSFDAQLVAETRSCNTEELSNLSCNFEEVDLIDKRIKGRVFKAHGANLRAFKEHAPDSRIIHLATHACIDDDNPDFNKVHLVDDYISNNDLQAIDLNAQLAVLSACNSGTGKLSKGEGVLSLSRGFLQAGCESVLMSLWSVDDCATSKIMDHFYAFLFSGQSRKAAIKNAKLIYITEANRIKKHPYYWAGFVHIGAHDTIEFQSNINKNIFLPILILSLLILFIFLRPINS